MAVHMLGWSRPLHLPPLALSPQTSDGRADLLSSAQAVQQSLALLPQVLSLPARALQLTAESICLAFKCLQGLLRVLLLQVTLLLPYPVQRLDMRSVRLSNKRD